MSASSDASCICRQRRLSCRYNHARSRAASVEPTARARATWLGVVARADARSYGRPPLRQGARAEAMADGQPRR